MLALAWENCSLSMAASERSSPFVIFLASFLSVVVFISAACSLFLLPRRRLPWEANRELERAAALSLPQLLAYKESNAME